MSIAACDLDLLAEGVGPTEKVAVEQKLGCGQESDDNPEQAQLVSVLLDEMIEWTMDQVHGLIYDRSELRMLLER